MFKLLFTVKKPFILIVFLLVAVSVSAQRSFLGSHSNYNSNDDFYEFKIGVEAGLNLSSTINSPNAYFTTGGIAGFNIGVILEVPVASPLTLSPEILYSQKGYTAITVNGNFTQHTQFIDIPLLAKFTIGYGISLYAGPQVSYLATLKNTYDNGFVTASEGLYDNSSNKLYWGGVAGISFAISENIDLRARYTIDLQQNYANGNVYVPGYRNQVLQFGLGYKF
jgi:opacity protein-like surface antigen